MSNPKRAALPALPAIGIGILLTCVGLSQMNPLALLSLAAFGLIIVIAGIVFGFVNHKANVDAKSKDSAPESSAT